MLRGEVGEGPGAAPTDHLPPPPPHPLGLKAKALALLLQVTFFTNGSVFFVSEKGLAGELPEDR